MICGMIMALDISPSSFLIDGESMPLVHSLLSIILPIPTALCGGMLALSAYHHRVLLWWCGGMLALSDPH
jgi:hypothetical protein